MSPELGLIVLAVIFAVGVVGLAVTMVALLPGALLADTWLEEVRSRRRREPKSAREPSL